MGEQTLTFAKQCIRKEADALIDLMEGLDGSFCKAVDLILSCKGKVIVTGVGKSGHVGHKIAATMASLGTPAFYLNPVDAYHGDLGMVDSEDVVIAISYSGQTDELLRIIPFLVDRQIPIIGISGNAQSLLAHYATCHLNVQVKCEADNLNLAPTSSTTAIIALGDALACTTSYCRNFSPEDFAQYHPGGTLGKRLLVKVKDVMRKKDIPSTSPTTTIKEALEVISKGKLGVAVVLDDEGLKGIITSGDIRRAVEKTGEACLTMQLEGFMTKKPITIYEDQSLYEAEKVFQKHMIHVLVVLDHRYKCVGLIDVNNLQ